MKKFVFTLVLFFCMQGRSTEWGLTAAGRTYVRGFSIEATAKEDLLLWGKKERVASRSEPDWRYGFAQVQAGLATHGQATLGASIFPISFLELNYKKTWTQRYSASSIFSCGSNRCYGLVSREVYTARMALRYQSLIFFASVANSVLRATSDSEPIVDELENLLINPSGDIGLSHGYFLGVQLEGAPEFSAGVIYRDFIYKYSSVKNEMYSAVLRKKLENSTGGAGQWFISLGTFKSDYSDAGLSLGLGRSWFWGESLSLF